MIPALQRVARSLLVLLVVVTLTFAIFYLAPIDPALQMCGKPCSPQTERIFLRRATATTTRVLPKCVWK